MARSTSASRTKRFRYSVENTGIRLAMSNEASGIYQGGQVVVPPTAVQGTRTIKHLTVSLSESTLGDHSAFWWALVFVPEGYQPNTLFTSSGLEGSVYEPNQFVLNCGYVDQRLGQYALPAAYRRTCSQVIRSSSSAAVQALPTL